MGETTWYRRSDGLEVEVRTGSQADKLLARAGAEVILPEPEPEKPAPAKGRKPAAAAEG